LMIEEITLQLPALIAKNLLIVLISRLTNWKNESIEQSEQFKITQRRN